MTADEIVRKLAASCWVYDDYVCFHCKSLVADEETKAMDEPHADDCPYALALAYVEANPEPVADDWGFLPGWCCPKDYCCVMYVGDDPCPDGW